MQIVPGRRSSLARGGEMPDEQQLTALRVGVVRRVGSTVPRTSAAPHVRLRLGSGQRVIAPAGGRGVRPPLDLLDGLQHLAAMGDQLAQLGAVGAVSAGRPCRPGGPVRRRLRRIRQSSASGWSPPATLAGNRQPNRPRHPRTRPSRCPHDRAPMGAAQRRAAAPVGANSVEARRCVGSADSAVDVPDHSSRVGRYFDVGVYVRFRQPSLPSTPGSRMMCGTW